MKKIKFFVLSILFTSTFLSCVKDVDIPQPAVKRDYQTQYNEDIIKIENYLKTHSISVINHPGFLDHMNVSYATVPSLDANSIWGINPLTPNANVLSKLVTTQGVVHKVYYLRLQDGVGTSPTVSSQIRSYYKCSLMDNGSTIVGSSADTGVDLHMSQLILGWREIFPLFKMGTISGPNQYNDYGAGVMFLPSAMAYYDLQVNQIPSYSPLIYNFKLFNVF